MIKRRKSKRGNAIADSITALISIVILMSIALVGYVVYKEFAVEMRDSPNINQQIAQDTVDRANDYANYMDNIIALVLVMSWIGILIFSFLVDSHPVFLIISILLMLVVLVVAADVSNTYQDLADDETISTYSADFPKAWFIADNLVMIILLIGASTMVVLYGKQQ